MNKKIIITGFIVFVVSAIISSEQNIEANTKKIIVDFNSPEWNNKVTKILPKQSQIGEKWTPLWSDSSNTYQQGEMPITTIRDISKSEITSTSYNYQDPEIGIIQVLVWHGEWVSEWDHSNAVQIVLQQVEGDVEKTIESDKLSRFCTMGYYDLDEQNSNKLDLLFTECAKDNYRIRINLSEGKYSQEALESMIMFSNKIIEQI